MSYFLSDLSDEQILFADKLLDIIEKYEQEKGITLTAKEKFEMMSNMCDYAINESENI